jgi:hypothetical protein
VEARALGLEVKSDDDTSGLYAALPHRRLCMLPGLTVRVMGRFWPITAPYFAKHGISPDDSANDSKVPAPSHI